MKASGVKWIGDIPDNWEISALFQLAKQSKNKNLIKQIIDPKTHHL